MKNKRIKINWGDEVVLPNGQIVQPKMLTPEESRVLNTNFMPAWQREFNDGKRDGYEKAMREGLWDNDNISVIRLTANGEVCDGGHRTSAAERANYTLCSLLIRGVPARTFLTTDTHKTRGSNVFISGKDKNLLSSLSKMFLMATSGYSPIGEKLSGTGSSGFTMNANDPAAFLHANREVVEGYARIASCMRGRSRDAVPAKLWAIVAAIARTKSGSDTWIYSITKDSPVLSEIKTYILEATRKNVSKTMQTQWIFCRLMADFREKTFNGRRFSIRQMPALMDTYARSLKGQFKLPTAADYAGAAEDLFKFANESAAKA